MNKLVLRFPLIVALLALAVSGCQGGTTGPEPTPAQDETVAAEPATPEEEVAPSEPVSIEFLFPAGGGREEVFATIIEQFEASHPGITVETRTVPYNDYFTTLPIMWASADPSDVVLVNGPDVQNYAYNGVLAPLDSFFPESDLQDISPSLLTSVSLDGHMYCAPMVESSIAIFYNTDYFEAAGIEPPTSIEDAWTWPEFVTNVQAVVSTQADLGKEIWGMVFFQNPPTDTYWSIPIIRSNGTAGSPTYAAISPDGTQVSGYADTPEAMEAYRFWQDLFLTWRLIPQAEVPDAFGTGNAATMPAFAGWGAILDMAFPDLNWGVMPLPYFVTPITHTGSMCPAVSANAAHPEEAMEFASYIGGPEGITTMVNALHDLPARMSVLAQSQEYQSGYLKIFADEFIEWGQPRPVTPGYTIYDTVIGRMMSDIAMGADIESTVASAVEELDTQLAQFR